MIRKLTSGQYRLYSQSRDPETGKRRNLGTFVSAKVSRRVRRESDAASNLLPSVERPANAKEVELKDPEENLIPPGASWLPVFDQLDFFAGAYLFVSVVHVPPVLATLASLPIVLAGSVAVRAIGWALGLKEAWI